MYYENDNYKEKIHCYVMPDLGLTPGNGNINTLLTDGAAEAWCARPTHLTDYYSSSFKTDKTPHTFYYK